MTLRELNAVGPSLLSGLIRKGLDYVRSETAVKSLRFPNLSCVVIFRVTV